MNYLRQFDANGQLIWERPLDGNETIRFSLGQGHSYSVFPEPGYQLNGHVLDCRCGTCRPDLDPWATMNGGPG